MKSTHRLHVNVPIEAADEVLSAEGWLSFVPGYKGLEVGDPNWPNEGSSIVVRFGPGPLRAPWKVTVVEYQRGRRFRTHEEGFSGLYIDDVDLTFQVDNGISTMTFVRDVTSKSVLVRILLFLIYPLRWVTMRQVRKRIQAMVQT